MIRIRQVLGIAGADALTCVVSIHPAGSTEGAGEVNVAVGAGLLGARCLATRAAAVRMGTGGGEMAICMASEAGADKYISGRFNLVGSPAHIETLFQGGRTTGLTVSEEPDESRRLALPVKDPLCPFEPTSAGTVLRELDVGQEVMD